MSNDITVRIKADAGPLKRGMNDGERAVKSFSQASDEMARRVAKSSAVVVTAVAAIGAGVLKMASEAAQAGVEIRNLAATAGTSTTNFQKMADATRTVGVEQDKLSDILKDVNDKFGDYMATGAGPLADFFENIAPKIGITAEAFANLSGPDALQLYVSSLEEAGLSQQQMTFYMEALASDATRLLPLLRNNGSEMQRLGNEAQAAGRILSEEMIQGAVELDRELAELSSTLKTQATAAVMEYKDEIIALINFITDTLIPSIGGFLKWVNDGVEGWRIIGAAANDYLQKLQQVATLSGQYGGFDPFSQGQPTTEGQQGLIDFVNGTQGGGGGQQDLIDFVGGIAAPMQGPMPEETPSTYGTPLDPTGGLLPEQGPVERARAAWEAQQELQAEIEEGTASHANRLLKIEEEKLTEEERLAEEAANAKKKIMEDVYNGLTSLMSSENDKLFKIGKAASIAEATVTGYKAATEAWEKGMSIGGPPVAAAFTAASLAKTGGLISKIASTQKSGGGSGGGGGGVSVPSGTSAGQEQAPSVTQNRSLTLIGDNFNRKQAIEIAEYINEGSENGLIIR